MNKHADFHRTAWQLAEEHEWVPSPLAGVERIMLDRRGDEVAVATSIVRYAPGASFDPHQHALGEEFIVLEGEFGDEAGRYPAGTYVRNPPGSSHQPFSEPGCVIFVKLRQFAPDDLRQCVLPINFETPDSGWTLDDLHEFAGEQVQVVRAAAGERVVLPANFHARELFVLSGSVTWQTDATRLLNPRSWFRLEPGHPLRVVTQTPAVLFAKTRPLTPEQQL